MITIKDIGDFESVPEIVSDIINGDTLALDKHLSEGFDIEEDIKLGKYTRISPLGLALINDMPLYMQKIIESEYE